MKIIIKGTPQEVVELLGARDMGKKASSLSSIMAHPIAPAIRKIAAEDAALREMRGSSPAGTE